jgi:Uma2 family endonuclease
MTQPRSLRQNLPPNLPSTAELPCSDDTPVDNELQNLLPNLLLLLLTHLWADRIDWYFGVDMAVYHTTGKNVRIPVVPDGFLSLNVARYKTDDNPWRHSYATWEENSVVPTLTLEIVSHKPGKEYDAKMAIYANLGVLYYVIYNPEFWRRDRHQPFEVYKLVNGQYQLQLGEPYWMPEIGLGIGRYTKVTSNITQELLTWFDSSGQRHLDAEEQERQRTELERQRAEQERQRAELERQRTEQALLQTEQERDRRLQLEAFLRAQGFDPEKIGDTSQSPD